MELSINNLLQKDINFITNMAKKYSMFKVPSWYWIPHGMTLEKFKQRRCQLVKEKGYYQGIGIFGKSTYKFIVPIYDPYNIIITYNNNNIFVNNDDLFTKLEEIVINSI